MAVVIFVTVILSMAVSVLVCTSSILGAAVAVFHLIYITAILVDAVVFCLADIIFDDFDVTSITAAAVVVYIICIVAEAVVVYAVSNRAAVIIGVDVVSPLEHSPLFLIVVMPWPS